MKTEAAKRNSELFVCLSGSQDFQPASLDSVCSRFNPKHEKEMPMGILGLTHDENGTALEKLPVTIKVAIGEGPEPGNGNNHPAKIGLLRF
jgi:hypothetical protein